MKVWTIHLTLLAVLLSAAPCIGMGLFPPPLQEKKFDIEVLAKAEIDECYNGIGQFFKPGPLCAPEDIPKANQAYLWGLTKAGDTLWIGTGANILCLMRAAAISAVDLEPRPLGRNLSVCEYAAGQYPEGHLPPDTPKQFGDFRQPKIYTYDLATRAMVDKTAQINDPEAMALLNGTFGLRSAVSFHDLIFFAGPVGVGQGVNIFVFDAAGGELIQAGTLPQYANIRHWLVLDDVLYTAVANAENDLGTVLRWNGTQTDPINFIEVGQIDADGAEIVAHNRRIYVGTWPRKVDAAMAGIWMSPEVPAGGLTQAHIDDWSKVWQADAYEPDPLIAHLYGVGAMASYGGKLHWGTMHVQGQSLYAVKTRYEIGSKGFLSLLENAWRPISIFRAADFNSADNVELLYGSAQLPVYHKEETSGFWQRQDNNMGGVPGKFGKAGFGNWFNNYTWTMAVYNDQLFVGTMDNGHLWLELDDLDKTGLLGAIMDIAVLWWFPGGVDYGADLWRFPSPDEPAEAVTENGFGNYTNYGLRTVVADEDSGLYFGTANPANIARDANGNNIGGWELIKVSKH